MKTKITILGLFIFAVSCIQAQEKSEVNISLGADLASSYVWRGFQQGTMPAVQPWGELSYKGFTLGTWGSYELGGTNKEIDIYAKYTLSNFSLQFVDLFFPGFVGLNQDFFNFKNSETGHAAELALSYNGSETIPFSVYGGMIVYGVAIDPKVSDLTKVNKSTYFEINYLGKANDLTYNIFAGFTPSQSELYATTEFSFINVGFSVKKAVKITDQFSVPLKLTVAANPNANKLFLAMIASF